MARMTVTSSLPHRPGVSAMPAWRMLNASMIWEKPRNNAEGPYSERSTLPWARSNCGRSGRRTWNIPSHNLEHEDMQMMGNFQVT
jgi:FtsP/CotA-like multicopper oxidase with cupredoxin domain